MSIRQFCINPEILVHYGKLAKIYFNAPLSYNRSEKLLNSIEMLSHTGKNFYVFLGPAPCISRIMVHWNIVLTIFHTVQIYQGLGKIARTVFQLQWDWPKNEWNQDLRVKHMFQKVHIAVEPLSPCFLTTSELNKYLEVIFRKSYA